MTKKRIIALLMTMVLLVGSVFTLASCTDLFGNESETEQNETDTQKNDSNEPLSVDNLSVETVSSDAVLLSASAPMLVSTTSGTSVSQTLTATVIPATASNKAVDWSVEWADSTNTATVTDYVTVTPASNGSTTATVTCKKAFSGNIVVTVTTRESGYTAECIVSFVGKPTDINVTTTLTAQTDGYHVGIGNTYTFNVDLSNPFGQVGSGYNNITVELSGVGSMILGYKEVYVSSGNTTWYDTSDTTVQLDSLKDEFITVNYADGVITVNTLKSIESYYESMQRLDSGRTRAYTNAFKSYVTDCYFTVKITENNSGISEIIKIHFDDTVVTGVSASASEMTF
ncbi:MAG: hypothetical protein J6D20_00590 [Clostridia bacterium]|nr:hypothetical protein [Clostridia bacterium]